MVSAGRFREDLFYRINVIPISLPPLRHRREDIPVLADLFARRIAGELERTFVGFLPEAMEAMESYPWPGNVRELENAVRRAVTLCADGAIPPSTLPAEVLGQRGIVVGPPSTDTAATILPDGEKVDQFLDHLKADLMQQALADCNYVQMEAARKLGMSFRSFRYYAKQFKLDVRPPGKGAGSGPGE